MVEFIIKYWLEVLFGVIVGIIGYYIKKIREQQEKQAKELEQRKKEEKIKQETLVAGVLALLRNELIRRFREYKEKGEMSMLDKENMEHMFEAYFGLGGNGMMHDVHKEFLEIPIKIIK